MIHDVLKHWREDDDCEQETARGHLSLTPTPGPEVGQIRVNSISPDLTVGVPGMAESPGRPPRSGGPRHGAECWVSDVSSVPTVEINAPNIPEAPAHEPPDMEMMPCYSAGSDSVGCDSPLSVFRPLPDGRTSVRHSTSDGGTPSSSSFTGSLITTRVRGTFESLPSRAASFVRGTPPDGLASRCSRHGSFDLEPPSNLPSALPSRTPSFSPSVQSHGLASIGAASINSEGIRNALVKSSNRDRPPRAMSKLSATSNATTPNVGAISRLSMKTKLKRSNSTPFYDSGETPSTASFRSELQKKRRSDLQRVSSRPFGEQGSTPSIRRGSIVERQTSGLSVETGSTSTPIKPGSRASLCPATSSVVTRSTGNRASVDVLEEPPQITKQASRISSKTPSSFRKSALTSRKSSRTAPDIGVDKFDSRQSNWSLHLEHIFHSARLWRDSLQRPCRIIVSTRSFHFLMFLSLLSALFLPDLWIIVDRPHNKDLDVILTLVLVFFLLEIMIQSIALTQTYWGSFFFWMDLLGAVSLLLDISYFGIMSLWNGGNQGVFSENAIIMRAARIAKLGARAGRFTKLMKLLRFLPGFGIQVDELHTAKVISARLITALATRVSCLIIIMVMIMPIFSIWSFPDHDWSPYAWIDLLTDAGNKSPQAFDAWLAQFREFYREKKYSPYKLTVALGTLNGTWKFSSPHGPPRRESNSVKVESDTVKVEFNFTTPRRMDALMSISLILLVITLMVVFSLLLTSSVSRLVLTPLEKLLTQVKTCAGKIFESVADMVDNMDDEVDDVQSAPWNTERAAAFESETALLAKVIDKLAVMGALFVKKGYDDEMEELGDADQGIFLQHQGIALQNQDRPRTSNTEAETLTKQEVLESEIAMIISAGLSVDLISSWDLNPLELDKPRCHAAAMFFLGHHSHGIDFDAVTMGNFLQALEVDYKSVPYHNWYHAVDVTHCVYRFFVTWSSAAYLDGSERYALLVASIGHDLGHQGLSNPFLVETSHELALRYNDRSPLENMHCARLFEITASHVKNNVFVNMPKKEFQDLRRMIAEAILHTDTARHFEMIKELQVLYEMHSDTFVAGRIQFIEDAKSFPERDVADILQEADSRSLIRKLILHLADISNPMKPFRVCRIWAWKICEEFFTQGDKEKALGIPVQSLNDREKVNKPFSQVGFIEFLVIPLAFAVIKVLPPFDDCVGQMISNMKNWQDMWVTTTKPPPAEEDQKALVERIVKLQRRFVDGG